MAERVAFLYEEAREWAFPGLARDLAGAGLRLLHPRTRISYLLDAEGEQREISESALTERIMKSDDVSFQWWLSDEHDIYCRVRSTTTARVVELGMEGCSPAEYEDIGAALRSRFLSNASRSLGLVFDPEGASTDYDWDDFFLLKAAIDWERAAFHFPAALGFRCVDEPLLNLPPGLEVDRVGRLCIVSAPRTPASPREPGR